MDWMISDAEEPMLTELELLEKSCFSLPWTLEQLKSQLPDENHIFLAALSPEGRVLGYVGISFILDEGYISNVAVAPEHRRRGIGAGLVRALLERAERLRLAFVTLEVRESNLGARALYEKLGFETVGRRKNYYSLPREDALLMTNHMNEVAEL